MEPPTAPASQASRMVFAASRGSSAKQFSRSAFTGRRVASQISRQLSSTCCSVTSRTPSTFATPRLVVARASNPMLSRISADPLSHGFGMRKGRARSCRARKAAALPACGFMGGDCKRAVCFGGIIAGMQFDYVIAGAGSAGCLLANRLSADPSASVLLLEAGGQDDWFWIDVPVGYLYTIANPRTDWCYKTEPDAHLAGRSIHYARGRVLGGCSSINAMIYMRGQKEDYDHWAALGNEDWSWDSVLPVFRQLEDYEHAAVDSYGAGGELRVENPRVSWEIVDAWRKAAAECGIAPVKSFNGGNNAGCAYFQMNQKGGRRWSATNAFIRPVLRRKNLTVLTGASVTKIRLDRK